MMHARFGSAHRQGVAALVGLISLSAPVLPAQERSRVTGAVDTPATEAPSRTRVFFVGRLPVWDLAGRREVREGEIDTAVLRRLQSRVGVAEPVVVPQGVAANTLNVDTTVDDPARSDCSDVVALDCSLRGAVAKANTLLGATQINVPAGTYTLTIPGGLAEDPAAADNSIGDLDVRVSDVSIVGAGAAATIIQQTEADDRVLEVNPDLFPGFVFGLSGVTIEGGRETTGIGGGGIISGSTGNSTTITSCRFTDNQASGAPGGAILNAEGELTVSGSTFNTNLASSDGGAIFFDGGNNPSSLTIGGSTFTGNSTTAGAAGGGLSISGPIASVAVARSHFVSNQAAAGGGAILNSSTPTGTISIAFSRFAGNTAGIPAQGNALWNTGGLLNAADNWWSVNAGPVVNDVVGATVSQWLQLRHGASPVTILVTQTTTLTADIFGRNTGGAVAAGNLVGLPAFPVPAGTIFSNAVLGTLSGASTQFVDGAATASYTAGGTGGIGGADATADSQTVTAPITVQQPPSVTSQPTNQTACAGSTATFTAAANGFPAPSVQWQVSTDGGATFTDIAGATSTTLSFTAAAIQDGNQYHAVFTNVAGTATSNAATLTVNVAPTVTTNPVNQTVDSGQAATFTAAASGTPTPTVQWQVSIDAGVTFTDLPGETSTTLSFTATIGQDGYQYRAVFTNSCGTATTTAATLTLNPPVAAVAVVSGDATICPGRTATIRADFTGTVPVDITWSDGFVQNGVASSPATRDVSPSVTAVYTITSISNLAGPGTASGSATVTVDPTCLSYYTVTPCRLADTRIPAGPSGPALPANTSRNFAVAGLCTIPMGAKAVQVVVTTANQTDVGYLRLYAAGGPVPSTSTVNFGLNKVRGNNAVVTLGTNGEITVSCVMPAASTGTTDVILDVSGFFQ